MKNLEPRLRNFNFKLSDCFFLAIFILTVFLAATPASNAKSRHTQVFNVRNYGAKGDGKTDDTGAIRAAIAAAGVGTGNKVLLPLGSYLYSDVLVVNGLVLEGQNATLLSDSVDAYVKLVGTGGGVSNLTFELPRNIIGKLIPINILIVQASNCTVSRNTFSFGFDPILRHWCILLQNATSCSITDNQVRGPGGIMLDGAINVSIKGNQIAGSQFINVPTEIGEIGLLSERGQNNSITENTIHSPSRGAQFPSAGIIEDKDRNCLVAGNRIDFFTGGIAIKNSANCRVERNQMECSLSQATPGAIDLRTSTNLVVDQNTIARVGTDGIRSEAIKVGLTISRNNIKDCGVFTGPFNSSVIYVDAPDAATRIESNQYSGNTSGLNYFIECLQQAALVTGNTTNTLLPNRIGP